MANPVRMPGTVIVLDHDPDVLTAARLLLTRHFEQVVTLSDPAQLAGAFGPECVALLLDMNFALGTNHGSEGLALLEQIRSRDEHVAVVLATG